MDICPWFLKKNTFHYSQGLFKNLGNPTVFIVMPRSLACLVLEVWRTQAQILGTAYARAQQPQDQATSLGSKSGLSEQDGTEASSQWACLFFFLSELVFLNLWQIFDIELFAILSLRAQRGLTRV